MALNPLSQMTVRRLKEILAELSEFDVLIPHAGGNLLVTKEDNGYLQIIGHIDFGDDKHFDGY